MTGPRHNYGRSSVQQRVRDWLAATPGQHGVQAIAEGARVPVRNVHQAMTVLFRLGEVTRPRRGIYEAPPPQQIEAAHVAARNAK